MPLGESPPKIFVGHSLPICDGLCSEAPFTEEKIQLFLKEATENGLDFSVIPVDLVDADCYNVIRYNGKLSDIATDVRQKYLGAWVDTRSQEGPYSLRPVVESDLILTGETWSSLMLFTLSPWILLDRESASPTSVKYCEEAFSHQLAWAAHCGVYAAILPTPVVNTEGSGWRCAQYARLLSKFLSPYLQTRVWIRIPLVATVTTDSTSADTANPTKRSLKVLGGWSVWNQLRTLLGNSPLVGIALELTSVVPEDGEVLQRWIAEPIRALIIPSSVFRANSSGDPALPKFLKNFVSKLMRHNVQLIIETVNDEQPVGQNYEAAIQLHRNSPSHSSNASKMFHLSHLTDCLARIRASIPPMTLVEKLDCQCLDQLQSPLQPLRDNLESQTYETFERDPIKYSQYQIAIRSCLEDRIAAGRTRHVIMVVGAGRGPLVEAALRALEETSITPNQYSVIAVEKNRNAVVTLRHRVLSDTNPAWRDVEVVFTDMRSYNPPEQADILISELLGSFGDNELSPECLDGAQRFLNKDGGVSIPSHYFSSLQPLTSPKLWAASGALEHGHETSHVVKIHSAYYFAKEGPQKCFEFSHPHWSVSSDNSHNHRYKELEFTSKTDTMCHGFAGYFYCVLYKGITISTHPPMLTKCMISWFPLYIPLKQLFFVKKDTVVRLHFWRLSDAQKVWYEWCVTEPVVSALHNVNGLRHAIQL